MKLVSMCLILFLSALLNQKLVALVCEGSEEGKKRVFWGDLHVHTAYSLDAYSFGTANSPAVHTPLREDKSYQQPMAIP